MHGDLIRILGDLADQRDKGRTRFGHPMIETTRLPDPAPVAQPFCTGYLGFGALSSAGSVSIPPRLSSADPGVWVASLLATADAKAVPLVSWSAVRLCRVRRNDRREGDAAHH